MPKCIFCCDGADLPAGEWCRCCGHGLEAWQDAECARIESLSGDELDAELRRMGLDPETQVAKFQAIIDRALGRK